MQRLGPAAGAFLQEGVAPVEAEYVEAALAALIWAWMEQR